MAKKRDSKAIRAINVRIEECKKKRDQAAVMLEGANALLHELLNIRDDFTKAESRVTKPLSGAAGSKLS